MNLFDPVDLNCNSQSILVLGAGGQVGRALVSLLGNRCVALTRGQLDVDSDSLVDKLNQIEQNAASPIRALINAAAYTKVDQAEIERDHCWRTNAVAPGVLAQWCFERGIAFVHYSTDYVFSGAGSTPWTEVDPTGPVNYYGESKLAGEKAAQRLNPHAVIIRTSWVYDEIGSNFVRTMIKLGKDREELKVVSDQSGAPTYARDLAQATLRLLVASKRLAASNSIGGEIYHVANGGETSWCEFAQRIFDLYSGPLKVKVVRPISTQEFPTPAKRPQNSRLNLGKLETALGMQMPMWDEALRRCLDRMKNGN